MVDILNTVMGAVIAIIIAIVNDMYTKRRERKNKRKMQLEHWYGYDIEGRAHTSNNNDRPGTESNPYGLESLYNTALATGDKPKYTYTTRDLFYAVSEWADVNAKALSTNKPVPVSEVFLPTRALYARMIIDSLPPDKAIRAMEIVSMAEQLEFTLNNQGGDPNNMQYFLEHFAYAARRFASDTVAPPESVWTRLKSKLRKNT